MTEMITIPLAEYQRLVELDEDAIDVAAANEVLAKLAAGTEELIPAAFADRIIDGESPLRVYRDYRGLTQVALSAASGVNRVQIAEIEARKKTGSVATLKKLATALKLDLDDLVP